MSEQRVMTEFGPGVIVASETVRGSTAYKIEGQGFSVWRTAQQIPEFGQLQWDETPSHKWDNSTTLPYNPAPQFYPRDGYSTIQPDQHVDPDRRLTPADSVSFEERPDSNAPGPNPALFASLHEAVDTSWSDSADTGNSSLNDNDAVTPLGTGTSDPVTQGGPGHLPAYDPYAEENKQNDYQQTTQRAAMTDDELQEALGGKYAAVNPYVDHNSLQAKLDDDPYRVLSDIRMSNLEKFQEDQRVREALLLEQADPELRTAAWADVRAKAIRLRQSGNIALEAANPQAIVATVTGDHGIYDVAVIKGNAINGSSAVTDWTCSCPWGDWAFERQHTFVGRLCSHAYAALLEHQSITQRGDKPYGWNDKVSSRHEATWPPQKNGDDEADNQNPTDQPEGDVQPEDAAATEQAPPDPNAQQAPPQQPPADPNATADPAADPNANPNAAAMGGALADEQSVADEVTQTLQAGGYDPSQYDVQGIAHDMYVWSDAGGGFIPRTDDESEFWSTVDGHATGGGEAVDPNAVQAARYPRPDGKLQTEPGTLTPDLHHIPKQRDKWRVDLHEAARLTEAERQVLRDAGLLEAGEFPHKQDHDEPFQGSGPIDDPGFSTSADYVAYDRARPGRWQTEVDELSDGDRDTGGVQGIAASREDEVRALPPVYQNLDYIADYYGEESKAVRKALGAHEESDGPENDGEVQVDVEDENDIVANFQREAGAYLMESGGGGGDDKIAQAAQAFLEKTAGRKFTLREQQELIEEAALDGPIDQSDLDLRGTHYLG